ncbi:acyltransferase family protein [Geodermatophilus amargosae]|uniref:acyltransferase family protein n=1 Tax=Geodermatophilus amargosae TaxID=1296565 RepID=UPI0034DFD808
MPRPTALPRLTSLRIFAALVVLGFHLSVRDVLFLPGLASIGYVGVGFFFILSGLVLAWGTSPGLPARTFYRRRFARVWPSHVVMLAVVSIVPVVAVTRAWEEVVPNLLLVQAWWLDTSTAFAFNGVSWSLACEAFFYATFPVVVVWMDRLDRRWQWALACLLLAGSALVGLMAPLLAYHLPLARYGEFLLGLVAGLALRGGWRPRVPVSVACVTLGAGALLATVVPFPLPNVVLAGPFLLVLLCAVERDTRPVGGWLRSVPMVFAGEVSFALYLVHETVILNLPPRLDLPPWGEAAVVLLVSGVAAVALHLLVERPANQLLRGSGGSVALADPHLVLRADDEAPPESLREKE